MSDLERNVDYLSPRCRTSPHVETDTRRSRAPRAVQNGLLKSFVHQFTNDNPPAFDVAGGVAAAPHENTVKEVITLLVAGDHPLVREGLVSLIHRQSELRVVAEAATGREAIEKFLAFRPDVGLLDLRMPFGGGIEVINSICESVPGARLVIVTTFDSEEDIYRALRAGARGYILKNATIDEIVACIREVGAGRTCVPPAVGAKLARRVSDQQLTRREMEVLRAVAAGKSNKEVGCIFNISEATVKVHVTHILEKLKVSGRTEAINVAARRGLVCLDGATA